jgi:plasmid replication initiation protein
VIRVEAMMESMAQNCIVEEINAFKDITIEKSKLKKAMQDNKYLWDNFK